MIPAVTVPVVSVPARPRLYYRAGCPKDRVIAAVSTWLSLGVVCGVPLSISQAREIFSTLRIRDGGPALLYAGRFVTGPRMALAVGAVMAEVLLRLCRALQRGPVCN